jgi:uncharacterized radical SAM superfamily protein
MSMMNNIVYPTMKTVDDVVKGYKELSEKNKNYINGYIMGLAAGKAEAEQEIIEQRAG